MGNDQENVAFEQVGDVAVITIDDGKVNAISHELVGSLSAALGRAVDEAKAIAIIGRDGKFSAGFNLTTMRAGPSEARDLLSAGAELAINVLTCPVPVVLGCTGHALAMGAILLSCGDVRIGAEGPFKIGMNEVAIGMPVPRFALELLRDRLSTRQFNAATNLATIYDPAGAVNVGFLDRVVDPAHVRGTAIDEATRLAAELQSPAFRLTREYVRGPVAERARAALAADNATFKILG